MRKVLVSVWLLGIMGIIAWLLWEEDWKYTLPTPVPADYSATASVNGEWIGHQVKAPRGKPYFVHFYNPECPCSRFNIPHFRSLVIKYGDRINFSIVVMSAEKEVSAAEIRERFDLDIPVSFDTSIADSARVYSTPQAFLADGSMKMYYRGNYNKSRFCEDKNTNYAQMSIDSLLACSDNRVTEKAALRSYGCSLPHCSKAE
jgi:hypothetical protein